MSSSSPVPGPSSVPDLSPDPRPRQDLKPGPNTPVGGRVTTITIVPEDVEVIDLEPPNGPMTGLGEDTVSHILSFLPMDSVLKAMRVDRKWESAARRELRHRKVLCLRPLAQCINCFPTNKACDRCRSKRFEDQFVGIDGTGDYPVLRLIMKMDRLKRLELNGLDMERFSFLIFQNAESLMVVTGVQRLPLSPPLVFHKIRKLESCVFDEEIARSCPDLTDLTIKDCVKHAPPNVPVTERFPPLAAISVPKLQRLILMDTTRDTSAFLAINAACLKILETRVMPSFAAAIAPSIPLCQQLQRLVVRDMNEQISLSYLPLDTMRYLGVKLVTPPSSIQYPVLLSQIGATASSSLLKYVVSSFSRLTHLSGVEVMLSSKLVHEEDGNVIVTLFDHLHELETVVMRFWDAVLNMDLLVERLVRGNSGLKHINLTGMRITDPVLETISSLPLLQSIELQPGTCFTTDGLLKLMTGVSGSSLTTIRVYGAVRVDLDRLPEQFVIMMTERLLTPHQEKWYKNQQTGDFSFC